MNEVRLSSATTLQTAIVCGALVAVGLAACLLGFRSMRSGYRRMRAVVRGADASAWNRLHTYVLLGTIAKSLPFLLIAATAMLWPLLLAVRPQFRILKWDGRILRLEYPLGRTVSLDRPTVREIRLARINRFGHINRHIIVVTEDGRTLRSVDVPSGDSTPDVESIHRTLLQWLRERELGPEAPE
ncbi:MAG: hypothetical protein GX616_25590 [Planctomycetes bacterium]|nr:hypothetical protein [Planctomycetota bacterium]